MGVRIVDMSGNFLAKLDQAIDGPNGALDEATQFGANKAKRSMPGAGANVFPGTGGDTGRKAKFIPSDPGQPPGVRTGDLRKSMTNARLGKNRWAFGTNQKHARPLEFGTATMAARPFLRPVVNNHRDTIGRVFNERLKKLMGGSL